jgi:alkanesulfonate monooxygenase SsuD/methylene tetrahydromethanopterin reductase-like flavin-dependent oxidoreductase (luciferase family)
MRLGTSLNSTYLVDDPREGARRMVERARAASDAGLDSLFVGDHHNVPVAYYQNTAILGRLLAEWDDRTAGALYLLPLWHPVLLAEQVGTLAAIHQGPFVIQCAIGADEAQFAALGTTLRGRVPRFEAALDVIRRLLAGEEVTTESPYDIRAARVNPRPLEPVEVWIGAAAPPAIDRAARLGDAFLAGPECTPARAREVIEQYRAACARHEREPAAIAIRRDVHVGADQADAERVAGPVLAAGYRGFDPDATVVGDVDSVTDQLAAYAELGYTDAIIRHLSPDQTEVLGSFERLGEVRSRLAGA